MFYFYDYNIQFFIRAKVYYTYYRLRENEKKN